MDTHVSHDLSVLFEELAELSPGAVVSTPLNIRPNEWRVIAGMGSSRWEASGTTLRNALQQAILSLRARKEAAGV